LTSESTSYQDYELDPKNKFPYINLYRLFYDLALLISGFIILTILFENDFRLNLVILYSGLWFLIVIIMPMPKSAKSKIIL
jgi:hypothetical protein